jgi:hypothetical protein
MVSDELIDQIATTRPGGRPGRRRIHRLLAALALAASAPGAGAGGPTRA